MINQVCTSLENAMTYLVAAFKQKQQTTSDPDSSQSKCLFSLLHTLSAAQTILIE